MNYSLFILTFSAGVLSLQLFPQLPSWHCCLIIALICGGIFGLHEIFPFSHFKTWLPIQSSPSPTLAKAHLGWAILLHPLCQTSCLPPFGSTSSFKICSCNFDRAVDYFYSIFKYIPILTCMFLLGLTWAIIYTQHFLNWNLEKSLENQNIIATGQIASLPKTDTKRLSFVFDLDSLNNQPQKTRVLLSWYNDYPRYPQFKVGDKWQLQVRLKRPHSTQNPGEFDYEAYLLQNHIRATGYVVNNPNNHCLNSIWYLHLIDRIRQSWEMKIRNSLTDRTYINFIVALLVGDQNNIDADEWQVLQRTGTIHFLVIAGLHIGFVAGLMFYLGKLLWRLFPCLCLLIPAQEAGAISALTSAILYSALAGFSIPTQRALIMIAVFMVGTLLRRNLVNFYTLLLTAFIILLLNPLSSLTSGFWLSFAAVFFIIYALHGRIQAQHKILRYGRLQWALTLGLLPFTLVLFQQAPLVSFFGNAIAVPWIGFVVIPLCFIGGLLLLGNETLGHMVLVITTKAIGLIWLWLEWLASLPIASWQHAISNIWVLLSAILGVLLLLAPRGLPARHVGIIWLLPLFFYIPPTPHYGEIWFTLLDVGQGLASVIRTKNHLLIYDTGPKFFDASDTGATIILPYLKNFALNKIDALVVSHGDADHSGGAKTLINNIPINSVITSVPVFFAPHPATHCYAGQNWRWDGVDFAFLHPVSNNNDFLGNNASCVLKISAGKNSILLNGDIETKAETVLVQNAGENLRAKILVAPHHGSQSSSSPTFVTAVQPEYVLFATGYLNRFHFPNNNVVARYQENHTNILNTAFTGAITFKYNAQSLTLLPEIYRIRKRKFWFEVTS